MSITGTGWYLFSTATDQSWNDVKDVWGLTYSTVHQYIYELSGVPITNGTTLTSNNWTPIDISNNNPILNQYIAYWVNVTSIPGEIQFSQYSNTRAFYQTIGSTQYYRFGFTNVNTATEDYLNSLNDIDGANLTLTYKINGITQYTYGGLLTDPSAVFMNNSGIIGFNFTSTPTLLDVAGSGITLPVSNSFPVDKVSIFIHLLHQAKSRSLYGSGVFVKWYRLFTAKRGGEYAM